MVIYMEQTMSEILRLLPKASGISTLTLYAFSTENWQRSANEINYLMKLPAIFFDRYMKELMDKNIKINLIGHLEHFPEDTKKVLLRAIEQSKDNTGMVLNFAMDYGVTRRDSSCHKGLY